MDESDWILNLNQSLENCNWRSALFISQNILSEEPDNFDALFGKAISLYCMAKYPELEDWMKSLPLEILRIPQILNIRCLALQNQKQYSTIISLLGGDFLNQFVPHILQIEEVENIPSLNQIRQNAIFCLSSPTDMLAFPSDFFVSRTGNKSKKTVNEEDEESSLSFLSDPLNPDSISETISHSMITHQPKLLQKYTKMCDKTSRTDDLLLTACGCYKYLLGDGLQGKAYVMKATEENPDCEIAWLSLIFMLIESSEFELGYTMINRVSRRFPNSKSVSLFAISLSLRSLSTQLAWPWILKEEINCLFYRHERAVALFMDGEIAQSRAIFERIINESANNHSKFSNSKDDADSDIIGSAHINLGHCLRRLGKYSEAIDYYQKSISYNANQPEALSSIGFTYLLMGRTDDAVYWLNSCLSINSVHPFATKILDAIFSAKK